MPKLPAGDDLAYRLVSQIAHRTGGQVRDLEVESSEDHIIIRGRSRTYYMKQLAQEAALDESGDRCILVNEIEVC
jgi:hypothetical protein